MGRNIYAFQLCKTSIACILILVCSNSLRAQVFERYLGTRTGSELTSAAGIAISADRAYVIDGTNSTIKVYSKEGTFLFQFGGLGSGDQQFAGPTGIALDAQGNVFVADNPSLQVKKFDKNGAFITKWGRLGSDEKSFLQLSALAVNQTTGEVFVGDQGNFRVAKYSNDGKFILSFGGYTTGADDEKFSSVRAVAVDGTGNVYVAEANTIKIFNGTTGKFLKKVVTFLPNQGSANQSGIAVDAVNDVYLTDRYNSGILKKVVAPLGSPSIVALSTTRFFDPRAIAAEANGVLYVVDRINPFPRDYNQPTILRILQPDVVSTSWGKVPPDSPTTFTSPQGIAANKDGQIFVADASSNNIQVFNSDGTPSLSFGSTGTASGTFNSPNDLVIDQTTGDIFIVESGNQRVQVFNASRISQKLFSGPGSTDGLLSNPTGITLDKNGLVVVADRGNQRIQRFTKAGVFVDKVGVAGAGDGQLSDPADVAVDSQGNIYVVESGNHRISKFNSTLGFVARWGSQGNQPGQFSVPSSIAVSADDHVFVLDAGNKRVQEFNSNGDLLQEFGENAGDFIAFKGPKGLAVVGNDLYVSDATTRVVMKFNRIAVTDFSPKSGAPGTTVTVTGIGIDPLNTLMSARIGSAPVVIQSATTNQFQITIPENATSNRISLFRSGVNTNSVRDFVVLPFAISRFTPMAATPGQTVTIFGSGFSTSADGNKVLFGTTPAKVSNATGSKIEVVVPEGVTKTKISISVADFSTVSQDDFTPTALGITSTTFPTYYQSGAPSAAFQFKVTNASLVKGLVLRWKTIADPSPTFKTAQVSVASNANDLTVTVPKEVFADPLGVKAFFELTDPSNIVVASDTTYVYTFFSRASMSPVPNLRFGKRPQDFQLISVPHTLTNSTVKSVFSDLGSADAKKWRLFGYSGADVKEITEGSALINQGTSYWLIVREATNINPGEGHTTIVTDQIPFKLKLRVGWNMIGNPFNFPISWNSVLSLNGNPTGVGTLRFFQDGAYTTNDTFKPYQGAFVNNASGDTLTLNIPARGTSGNGRVAAPVSVSLDQPSWLMNLKVSDGTLTNELIGFGMQPNALVGRDRFDEGPIPTPEGLNTFNFLLRKQFHRDIVPTAKEFSWSATVSSAQGVTIEWDKQFELPPDRQLVAEIDGMAGIVDMRKTSSLYVPHGHHVVRFHLGGDRYIATNTKSDTWILGDPSPNPLEPGSVSFNIALNVPTDHADLTIHLIDVTGRRYDLGTHVLSSGRSVQQIDLPILPTGLYIGQFDFLSSGGMQRFTRKILVR